MTGVSASEASKNLDCRFSSSFLDVRLDLDLRLARLPWRGTGFVQIGALLPGCRQRVPGVLG